MDTTASQIPTNPETFEKGDKPSFLLRMDGTMQGIKFPCYGCYYSGRSGTLQFITCMAQSLTDEYKGKSEALLNGLVETK